MTPLEMGVIEFCTVRAFVLWHVLQEETQPLSINVYPPPSGRHAMRSLYVIGRDGWVRDGWVRDESRTCINQSAG